MRLGSCYSRGVAKVGSSKATDVANGPNITGRGPIRFRNASYWNADGTPAEGPVMRSSDCENKTSTASTRRCFSRRCSRHGFSKARRSCRVRVDGSRVQRNLAQDFCSIAPDRLIGNAVIPVCGIDAALADCVRCTSSGCARSVFFLLHSPTARSAGAGGRRVLGDDARARDRAVAPLRLRPVGATPG